MIQQTNARRSSTSLAPLRQSQDGPDIWSKWSGGKSVLYHTSLIHQLIYDRPEGIIPLKSYSTHYVLGCVALVTKCV